MRSFQYVRPDSLDQLLGLLHEHGPEAKLLAGGTDLVVRLRSGRGLPRIVIDLKRIGALRADVLETGGASESARAVMADLIEDRRVRHYFPALVEAAGVVGSVQIRNRATLAGNICNASPAADTVPALLVYGAGANLVGCIGRRSVPLTEFFLGPGRTVLNRGEILESIDAGHIHTATPCDPAERRACRFGRERQVARPGARKRRRSAMAGQNKVIEQFLGDAATPIVWASEEETQLHFWLDDLHCPQPISPMWFDVGGWWYTCNYMYRRFAVPFGKDWVAKTVNEYVFSAVVPREVPRDPQEGASLDAYYNMVMPVYAANFLHWWKQRYLPEILRNFEFLDGYPMETATLPELMILLEDALDIQERHFRLHWVLNLAQFQSAIAFQAVFTENIGAQHGALIGRILVSDDDRNWDSIRELWKLKNKVASNATLKASFDPETADGVLRALAGSEAGRELLKEIDAYKMEYGNKSIYTHEYLFTTWRENPTPIVEALRGYLLSGYDYEKDVRNLRENRAAAIAEMWSLFPAERPQADRQKIETALDLALKMTPLTPDHHFYMDQGTYARVRLVFMAVGRKLVAEGVFTQADDVLFLKYEELRRLSANFSALDGKPDAKVDMKSVIQARRKAREAAFSIHPRNWVGTITEWSLFGEPYKSLWGWPDIYTKAAEMANQPVGTVRGLPASAGMAEGPARIVHSPEEFDQVRKGDILVCKMTNPAWVVVFTKIAGLVTDAGGALSHPAVVSREFGIPAVVGTSVATQKIKNGQRVRVNGAAGIVEILEAVRPAAV